MFRNSFVKRYKSIPIARYSFSCCQNNVLLMIPSPEIHNEFEIICIEKGYAILKINNQTIEVKKGDMIFISPCMLHSLEVSPQPEFSHICFCFDLKLLSNTSLSDNLINNSFCIVQHIESESPHNSPLKQMFYEINNAIENAFPYWELNVRGNLSLIFAYLMQNNLVINSFNDSYDKDFCIKVYKYIETHYKERINSKTVSKELNYNQSYFCRLFKKNFSMCFSEYLSMYRIEQSKHLLENSAISIAETAGEVGFSNLSYFTKLFRIQNGISPKKFRELYFN